MYANNMLNLAPESWVIDEDWTWPERANLHEYETFVILKKTNVEWNTKTLQYVLKQLDFSI